MFGLNDESGFEDSNLSRSHLFSQGGFAKDRMSPNTFANWN